jgi:hypothetical protein
MAPAAVAVTAVVVTMVPAMAALALASFCLHLLAPIFYGCNDRVENEILVV